MYSKNTFSLLHNSDIILLESQQQKTYNKNRKMNYKYISSINIIPEKHLSLENPYLAFYNSEKCI